MNYGRTLIRTAFVLCLIVGALQLASAQVPRTRPTPDPLGGLKRALNEAGAPALSAAQEEQLKTLITAYHQNNPDSGPGAELQAAQKAYEDAILAGDSAAAQSAATTIAGLISAATTTRLQALASFEIQALSVLLAGGDQTSSPQVAALVQKFGASGLVHLLRSLVAGGPGGFGGPHGGPGPFGGRGNNFAPRQ
jgi:hypothetical protein